MKPIPFIYKSGRDGRAGKITLTVDGELYIFDDASPNFTSIITALMAGAWSKVSELVSIKNSVAQYTNGLVQIVNGELQYNGLPLHSALASRIVEAFNSGSNYEFLVNFLNKVQLNPLASARDEIYLFLDACDLPITDDGDFYAYKYVRSDYMDCYSGKFDNSVGSKPEMKPEECDSRREVTCSRGLHFCSRSYLGNTLSSTSHRIMKVKVNPANVIAIPNDYNNAKGRAWTYEVVDELFDEKLIKSDNEAVERDLTPTADDRKATKAATASRGSGVKLTESDVLDIRRMLKDGFSYPVIGAKYGVHRRTVERIAKGDAWKSVKLPVAKKPAKKSAPKITTDKKKDKKTGKPASKSKAKKKR